MQLQTLVVIFILHLKEHSECFGQNLTNPFSSEKQIKTINSQTAEELEISLKNLMEKHKEDGKQIEKLREIILTLISSNGKGAVIFVAGVFCPLSQFC